MKDMDIQEFLSTEIPVSTPNEHGVYCRDCQTWVTIVDTPKLKMSVIVARSEQGYLFSYDSFDNTKGLSAALCTHGCFIKNVLSRSQ